jgi:hypothetical protein
MNPFGKSPFRALGQKNEIKILHSLSKIVIFEKVNNPFCVVFATHGFIQHFVKIVA